ncbi:MULTISPECIES: arginyltransferase [unclassified Aminobacter]|uniref:arginyltransferase n=1 Tax=unclassified Aminobacter TaxID=2644704 RepID=UPI000466E61F|nr:MULTISPECIES: arginyltransferase [unclassified Aminobacter]TWG67535.1 arginine-tRNA-protein transferase [Aminobacter sp. J44]TWH35546.1 arginine-tRNA-protein transferase [Aminobacter sp. J15]
MTHQTTQSPQFFLTAPAACPYLEGQQERKVFTHLVGDRAPELNDLLTQGGFRRSQNIAYRPACETCRACVSVRILVDEFKPTRNMKRVLARNSDLIGCAKLPETSTEQYSLFRTYLDRRHRSGGMSDMSVFDYAMMVEDTHVDTMLIEYRRRGPDSFITGEGEGELIAVALTDRMSDGLSMVYSFFDPDMEDRSLGTFMILDHINRARAAGLPHIYLGYWVNGSRKMSYKIRFEPQEHLGPRGWERFDPDNAG